MTHRHDDPSGTGDRTLMIDVNKIKSLAQRTPVPVATSLEPMLARAWQPFSFSKLEKVSKSHQLLLRDLEWLLPNVGTTGEVAESVQIRLQELIHEKVTLAAESMTVVNPAKAQRYLSDPTFLAVLAPVPNRTRGLLEVELSLAHQIIDMLLGGAGEAIALRPLTDLEEGVLTYVLIETLKVFAPALDPSLPKLRLERVCRSFAEAVVILGEDEHLAVVQLKAMLGPHAGYVRLFIPESVLAMAHPHVNAEVRRARRSVDAHAHAARLSQVKVWLRAEIGQVEISTDDLSEVREGDVILLEALKTRPDLKEAGTATLKLGYGRAGSLQADVKLENERYRATITQIQVGEPSAAHEAFEHEEVPPNPEAPPVEPQALGEASDESTSPGQKSRSHHVENAEGADLLNDIPLQIAVELGRVPMTAEEIVGLKVGHVIDLNRSAGEPLDLSVNGKVVARGELVEVDGNLGVRILSLAG